MTALQIVAVPGLGRFAAGDDLAGSIAALLPTVAWPDGSRGISDGDVVVVTSKVVAKAEGRVVAADDREDATAQRPRASSPVERPRAA